MAMLWSSLCVCVEPVLPAMSSWTTSRTSAEHQDPQLPTNKLAREGSPKDNIFNEASVAHQGKTRLVSISSGLD